MADKVGRAERARLERENVDAIVAAVRAVKAGERGETGFGTPDSWAVHFGFLSDEAVKKPCPTCGTPRVDYRYAKITRAGRALLALADTHPKGGDTTEIVAPFMSGAVAEGETPNPPVER